MVSSYYAVLTILVVKIDGCHDAGEECKVHHSYSISNWKTFKSEQSPFMNYHHHNFFTWRVIMKNYQLDPLHLSANLEFKRNPCRTLHLLTLIHNKRRQQDMVVHRLDLKIENAPNTVTLKRGGWSLSFQQYTVD